MNEKASPLVIVPLAFGETADATLRGCVYVEGSTAATTGIVCLDPEAFPSAIEVTLTIRHRAYTWNVKLAGLSVDHSVSAPGSISHAFSCSPAIALLSGTTWRLPISNLMGGDNDAGETFTAGNQTNLTPVWGSPNNFYSNLTMHSQVVLSGQSFERVTASTKIVCHDCDLTAYYGLVDATGLLDGKLHAQFRRNATATADVTGVYRVWEGSAFCFYEWTGLYDVYSWSIDEWQLVSSDNAYSSNRSGWATYKRQLSTTDTLSLDPTGAFSYVTGSGSNPSAYIFDLARNDIYAVTGKTA